MKFDFIMLIVLFFILMFFASIIKLSNDRDMYFQAMNNGYIQCIEEGWKLWKKQC